METASNKITFTPSIPREHGTVRSVERVYRTLQEMVVKSLALKPHLSPEFWGMAYLHNIDILNIIPTTTKKDTSTAIWLNCCGTFATSLANGPVWPVNRIYFCWDRS